MGLLTRQELVKSGGFFLLSFDDDNRINHMGCCNLERLGLLERVVDLPELANGVCSFHIRGIGKLRI